MRKNILLLFKLLVVTLFSVSSVYVHGQPSLTSLDQNCYSINGTYVSGLREKLGNIYQENLILDNAKNNGFNYLILHETQSIFGDPAREDLLANFIARAKTSYDIDQIGAVTEVSDLAQDFARYNNERAYNERIDVINLEFEFWWVGTQPTDYCHYLYNYGDGTCTRSNAFNFFIDQLINIKEIADPLGIETEIYIGWPTIDECITIAERVDRILIHYYRQNDIDIANYGISRLEYLARANRNLRIAPIFSAEGYSAPVPYMSDWLLDNSKDQAFTSWFDQYNAIDADWKSQFEIMGATWYTSRFIVESDLNAVNHITSSPNNVTTCARETATFSVSSSATNKIYYWSKDGQCLSDNGRITGTKTSQLVIQNVMESDIGSYHCRVVGGVYSFVSEKAALTISDCGSSSFNAEPFLLPGVIEAEEYNLGGEGIGYHDLTPQNSGGYGRLDEGVDVGLSGNVGQFIGWTRNGEWLEYAVEVLEVGLYDFEFRIASPFNGGLFHVTLDGEPIINEVSTFNTGGYQTWESVLANNILLPAGKHDIKIHFDNANFNLDKMLVTSSLLSFNEEPFLLPGVIEAEEYNLGGEGIGYHDLTSQNSGGYGRLDEGVDVGLSGDVGQFIGWTRNGEWLDYTVDVLEADLYDFEFRIASPFNGGSFHVTLDGELIIDEVSTFNTGGYQTWESVSTNNIFLPVGKHDIKVHFDNANFNLDKILVAPNMNSNRAGSVANTNDIFQLTDMVIYPNPIKGDLHYQLPEDAPHQVKILDMNGKEVLGIQQTHSTPIDVSGLSGMYILQVTSQNGVITKRISIQ